MPPLLREMIYNGMSASIFLTTTVKYLTLARMNSLFLPIIAWFIKSENTFIASTFMIMLALIRQMAMRCGEIKTVTLPISIQKQTE